MWAPSHHHHHHPHGPHPHGPHHVNNEGMGQYPLLPPPPPPPYPEFHPPSKGFHMAPHHPHHNPPAFLPHQPHIRPQGGRGRGRGRGAPPGMHNHGARMPSGLVGPWQQNLNFNNPASHPHHQNSNAMPAQHQIVQRKPEVAKIPKTPSGAIDTAAVKRKLLEGLVNVKDESYPKELLDKFSPLKCDLCVAKMNSTMQSKMHYSGKQHLKKVRMFMATWSQANGVEPSPKRAKTSAVEVTVPDAPVLLPVSVPFPVKEESETSKPPEKTVSLYCQCCDLSFTSALHAEQHYMGRNHARVLSGQAPLKAGFFNPTTGKWQRRVDPSGRFGIGTDFLAEPPAELQKGRFYCNLCNVGATSQEQLELHLNGAKHKRMQAGTGKPKQPQDQETPVTIATPDVAVQPQAVSAPSVAAVKEQNGNKSNLSAKNLALFRTPSGKFYCQPCNLTLNSESQFTSHTESKKHKLRQASQKPAMVLTGPKAAQWGDKATFA